MFETVGQYLEDDERAGLNEINVVILNGATAALFATAFDDLFDQ